MPRAKGIRKYYLSVEKLIRKYYKKIRDDLYKEIDIKNNQ